MKVVLYTAPFALGHVWTVMPRLLYSLLPLCALLLMPSPAAAVRVENLYRAEVEVEDKGGEARAEGFREALEQVVIKLTGSAAVVDDPALEPLLQTPARYVQQYRYQEIETDAEGEAEDAAGANTDAADAPPAYRLEVRFAPAQVEEALREREATVWDPYRPQVLTWLAFDDGRRRALVAADADHEMFEAVRSAADRRGIPLLLPLLDTEDRQRIEYLDVQGRFLDTVRAASERYRAPLTLVGSVQRSGGGWRGDWTLLGGEEQRGSWTTRAESAEAVVRAGIGGLAERMARAYAGRDREQTRLRVRVLEADDLGDYARLSTYFQRLPRVESLRLVRVRPSELMYELDLRGSSADLERAISLDDLLVPVSAAEAGAAVDDAGAGSGEGDAEAGVARTIPDAGGPSAAPADDEAAAAVEPQPGTGAPVAGPAAGSGSELLYRLAG